jgi:Mor family transcriptional regulator
MAGEVSMSDGASDVDLLRAAEFVRDAVAVLAPRLAARFDLQEADAVEAARDFVHDICDAVGGQSVYIPRDVVFGLTARDYEIFRVHNGRNTHELALKHQLCDGRIRQICAAITRQIRANSQMNLPGLDSA